MALRIIRLYLLILGLVLVLDPVFSWAQGPSVRYQPDLKLNIICLIPDQFENLSEVKAARLVSSQLRKETSLRLALNRTRQEFKYARQQGRHRRIARLTEEIAALRNCVVLAKSIRYSSEPNVVADAELPWIEIKIAGYKVYDGDDLNNYIPLDSTTPILTAGKQYAILLTAIGNSSSGTDAILRLLSLQISSNPDVLEQISSNLWFRWLAPASSSDADLLDSSNSDRIGQVGVSTLLYTIPDIRRINSGEAKPLNLASIRFIPKTSGPLDLNFDSLPFSGNTYGSSFIMGSDGIIQQINRGRGLKFHGQIGSTSPTATRSFTSTPSPMTTSQMTSTATRTATVTRTFTPFATATITATRTITASPTRTGVPTLTPIITSTSTNTPIPSPTFTSTSLPTSSPSATFTIGSTSTRTATKSHTATITAVASSTATKTSTATPTYSRVPTDVVPVATNTATMTATAIPSVTNSRTATPSPTWTVTATRTFTNTVSATVTPTPTNNSSCSYTERRLLPSFGVAADSAGTSVARAGSWAIMGIPGDDDKGASSGSALIYQWNGTSWQESLSNKLLAFDGQSDDHFGYSVDMEGDLAVVGAFLDDDKGNNSGSAYIYRRSGNFWNLEAKIIASDGVSGDYFGFDVATDGSAVIVSAYGDDDKGTSSGSIYVFTKPDATWIESQKLIAPDGVTSDFFGISVAADAGTIVVGADLQDGSASNAGAAYVYSLNSGLYKFTQKLMPPNNLGNRVDARFGIDVSVSGGVIVVGAYNSSIFGPSTGEAHVFRLVGGVWQSQGILSPPDASGYESFGQAVAVNANLILIGAPTAQDRTMTNPKQYQGAIYLYKYNSINQNWAFAKKVFSSDGWFDNYFGTAVAIDSSGLMVGSPGQATNGTDAGAAYMYNGACN